MNGLWHRIAALESRHPPGVSALVLLSGPNRAATIHETGETLPLAEYEHRVAAGLRVRAEQRVVLIPVAGAEPLSLAAPLEW